MLRQMLTGGGVCRQKDMAYQGQEQGTMDNWYLRHLKMSQVEAVRIAESHTILGVLAGPAEGGGGGAGGGSAGQPSSADATGRRRAVNMTNGKGEFPALRYLRRSAGH